ncbi:MAG: Methyltransferase type 11 [Parcubacteria group bacterium]|nr:Methyltransferase type 11 [Parcubacteria group bacterium]
MLNWYNRVLLPRFIERDMDSGELIEIRRTILKDVTGTVLELGIGAGYSLPLYPALKRLYALEPSEGLIKLASTRVLGLAFPVEFLHAKAEAIPLPDASVDLVVSTWSLCSVDDPRQVLLEVNRVLRTGGRFLFVEHGASPYPFVRAVQKLLTLFTKDFTGNCHWDRKIDDLITSSPLTTQVMKHCPEPGMPLTYNFEGCATRV